MLLTSNNTRELSEALKRRCLYLFIDYPSPDTEINIVRMHVPDSAPSSRSRRSRSCSVAADGSGKTPSVSETIDWARALVTLNADNLDRETLETTLTVLLKHESDVQRVRADLDRGTTERRRWDDENMGGYRRLN